MIALPTLFALAVFGATGLWYGHRLTAAAVPRIERVGAAWQVLLAVTMTAFAWIGTSVAALQIVLFTVGALWFVAVAVFQGERAIDLGGRPGATLDRAAGWYGALMMTAVAWVAIAAPPRSGRAGPESSAEQYAVRLTAPPASGIALGSMPTTVLAVAAAVAAAALFLLVVRESIGARPGAVRTAPVNAAAITAVGMSYALFVLVPRSS